MGRPAAQGPVPLRPAALTGIFGLALAARLLFLRHDSTFQRTDEVMALLNALRLQGLLSPPDLGAFTRDAFEVLSYPWGYPVLLFAFAAVKTWTMLGVPITEFTAVAPFAVLGALAPLLVYALANQAFDRRVALGAGLAVALLPSHIAQSRTIAAWILASNLMMLTLLACWRYLKRGQRWDALAFSAALAAYLPSDNLAPGTLILLVLVAWFWEEGTPAARARRLVRTFVRPAVVILPALTVTPLVAVHVAFVLRGHPTYGFLGHYFESKVERGVHLTAVAQGLAENAGPALLLVLVVGVVRAALAWRRGEREWVFLAWLASFLLPTVFVIDPRSTVLRAYLTPVILPLLVFGVAGLVEGAGRFGRRLGLGPAAPAVAVTALVFLGAAVVVPTRVYGQDILGIRARPIGLWGGEVYANDGAKSAGYWIRTSTPPGTVVLSDVRLFVGKYYFHRPTIPPSDPRFALERFQRIRDRVGLVGLTAGFHDVARSAGYLEGYALTVTVTHRGQPVFFVYARPPRPDVVLATEEIDPKFDHDFGRIDALRDPNIWEDELPTPPPA